MNRRNFLRNSIAGTAALAGTALLNPACSQEADKPLTMKDLIDNGGQNPRLPEEGISCYPDIGNGNHQLYQLWIRKNNNVLTSYRAHPSQKYPFFYPLLGPASGISLTSESGKPWPHHRSVFFGLDRVNGGNYWQDTLAKGQIISEGPSFAKDDNGQFLITPTSAVITDKCFWKRDGEAIIEDNRRFTLRLIDNNRYVLEAEINVKMLTDITVEKTNHGLFGIRCAPDIAPTGGGILLSSEGDQGQEATLGKPARWLAFYGRRVNLKEEIVEGAAVFCPSKAPHPKFENCPWFTRDYGNISPTPCNFFQTGEKLELPKDSELKFRHWVVAFAGTPKDAGLDGLWEEFDKG